LIENQELQIILGKVRRFTSPGRGPSTGFDHCSSAGACRFSLFCRFPRSAAVCAGGGGGRTR